MIVGLEENIALLADMDYAIGDIESGIGLDKVESVYGIADIKESILRYIFCENDTNTSRFYFDYEEVFIYYRDLDKRFTRKFREYSKNRREENLQLVVNNK